MQYMLTPYSEKMEPFVWWEGAFTDPELDWLQNKAKNATNKAKVGGSSGGELKTRTHLCLWRLHFPLPRRCQVI